MSKWDKFVRAFINNEGYKKIIEGLDATVKIAFFAFVIGIILGTILAVIRIAGNKYKELKIFKALADLYVTIFRGTPIVVQLLIIYYILLPLLGIRMDNIMVAAVTFGLNSAAYVSEIMRGGINSVDNGQFEAGRSLGLSYPITMLKIVFPQAFKNSLPTLGNELIALIKDTSVVSFIAVTDLTLAFKNLGASTYEYTVPYLMLALTYLVIVLILTYIIKLVERRLNVNERRN